jgi:hypothetical protein
VLGGIPGECKIAYVVERVRNFDLAKVEVAGSNPVSRSSTKRTAPAEVLLPFAAIVGTQVSGNSMTEPVDRT